MTTGETFTELTGAEGGVWQVHTRDNTHMFDLDAWTADRHGANANRFGQL